MQIVRCVSCEGFGWFDDADGAADCDWCRGVGYTYRGADGADRPIPPADFERVAGQLETLEKDRLREMGYSGEARRPWEQAIRRRDSDG